MAKKKVVKSGPAQKAGTVALFYHCSDGGDGSCRAEFHPTREAAEAAEAEMEDSMGHGWAEPSVSSVQLRIKDGVIEFLGRDADFKEVWYPLPPKH